jgi:hypothetical protein
MQQERVSVPDRLSNMQDIYLRRLGEVLWEFIHMSFHPSPCGLRQVADVLLEVRSILLVDDLLSTDTQRAIQEIEFWIENTKRGNSYDLAKVLRSIHSAEV